MRKWDSGDADVDVGGGGSFTELRTRTFPASTNCHQQKVWSFKVRERERESDG